MRISRIWHMLVEAWVFFMTFILMPLSSYAWLTDPMWLPWGYFFVVGVPVCTLFLIFSWFDQRGYLSE